MFSLKRVLAQAGAFGLVAASAVVTDDEGRVLLQRRRDNDLWALPGGGMEMTDSLPGVAVREVKEAAARRLALANASALSKHSLKNPHRTGALDLEGVLPPKMVAAAKAAGQSTANLELQDLSLRIARGEMNEFERVLRLIQTNHMREPGVAQALQRLLIDSGLLTPDGRPVNMPVGPAGGAIGEPAADEAGKIWTPQSEQPGQKSSLWIPD